MCVCVCARVCVCVCACAYVCVCLCVCVHPDPKLRVLEMTCRFQFVSRVKDVPISACFDCRGVRHDCGTALNEATTVMGYRV